MRKPQSLSEPSSVSLSYPSALPLTFSESIAESLYDPLDGDWSEVDRICTKPLVKNHKAFLYAIYKQQFLEHVEHRELQKVRLPFPPPSSSLPPTILTPTFSSGIHIPLQTPQTTRALSTHPHRIQRLVLFAFC